MLVHAETERQAGRSRTPRCGSAQRRSNAGPLAAVANEGGESQDEGAYEPELAAHDFPTRWEEQHDDGGEQHDNRRGESTLWRVAAVVKEPVYAFHGVLVPLQFRQTASKPSYVQKI